MALVSLPKAILRREMLYSNGKPAYFYPVPYPGEYVVELEFKDKTLLEATELYRARKAQFIEERGAAQISPPAWIDIGYWDDSINTDTIVFYYQLVYPGYTSPKPDVWSNWPTEPAIMVPHTVKTYQDALKEQLS